MWRRLVARNDLTVGQNDGRCAIHADRLAEGELFGNRVIALGGLDFLAVDHFVHGRFLVFRAPHRLQLLVTRRAQALARERDVTHFDAALVQLRHFGVQLVAVRAGGVGEYGDVRLGFANGRVDNGFGNRDGVDQLGDALALGLLGQVDRLAVLEIEQVALNHVLAVGAGVQHTAALELDFVQAWQRAGGDGLYRHFELEVFQAFTNGFVGRVIGDGKGADQRNGCGGENLGQTHENS
ncbi:hypothetical protein D3C71_1565070 [compost metagenome]